MWRNKSAPLLYSQDEGSGKMYAGLDYDDRMERKETMAASHKAHAIQVIQIVFRDLLIQRQLTANARSEGPHGIVLAGKYFYHSCRESLSRQCSREGCNPTDLARSSKASLLEWHPAMADTQMLAASKVIRIVSHTDFVCKAILPWR